MCAWLGELRDILNPGHTISLGWYVVSQYEFVSFIGTLLLLIFVLSWSGFLQGQGVRGIHFYLGEN